MANPCRDTFRSSRTGRGPVLVALIGFVAPAILTFCQFAPGQEISGKFKQLDVAPKYKVELAAVDADKDTVRKLRSQYKEQHAAIKDDRSQIRSALESNQNAPGQLLTEFMEGYEFPSMTQTDIRVISKLGETRTRFIKNYLNSKVAGNPRRNLIDLTIKSMETIYSDKDLHPAARLNAVYLLGQLDDIPANRTNNQAPQPSAAAFASLLNILSSNDGDASPGFVKVAALAGVQRHLEIDRAADRQLDAGEKQVLLSQITTALQSDKEDELTYWLKRRSMQIAGLIGDAGILDSTIDTLKSNSASLWLQLDAIDTIGKLDLDSTAPDKKLETALVITEFLARAYRQEADIIESLVDQLVFDNILFHDVDLIAVGTNYEEDIPAATNGTTDSSSGSGGRSGDKKRKGSGNKMSGMGGMGGAGGPGEGGPGEGSGGGSGGGNRRGAGSVDVDPDSRLELPNYELDNIRNRIKSLAFKSVQVLGKETEVPGLRDSLSDDGKAFVDKVVRQLDITLDESNAGIIDRDARSRSSSAFDDDEEDQEYVTEKLKQLCHDSSDSLSGFAREQKGEPEAADDEADAGTADAEGNQ